MVERIADAGMGEFGIDRCGAAGGKVEAIVESTDTAGLPGFLKGDEDGVAAMLKFAGRGGKAVSAVISLDEPKLALCGVSDVKSATA